MFPCIFNFRMRTWQPAAKPLGQAGERAFAVAQRLNLADAHDPGDILVAQLFEVEERDRRAFQIGQAVDFIGQRRDVLALDDQVERAITTLLWFMTSSSSLANK